METKVYVVFSQSSFSFSYGGTPLAVFLSKEEAEFFVHCLERKSKPQEYSMSSTLSSTYYSIEEIPLKKQLLEGKEYKKFVEEKVKKLEKEIAELEACSEKYKKSIEQKKKELTRPYL